MQERLDETLWNTINMVACEIPPLFPLAVHVPSICLSRLYSQSAIRLSTKSPFLQVSKVGLQSCREGSKRSFPSALPSANISTIRTRVFTTMLLLLFLYVYRVYTFPVYVAGYAFTVRVCLTAELCACANYKSRAPRRLEDKLEIWECVCIEAYIILRSTLSVTEVQITMLTV